jgi:hypothetical protein
MLATEVMVEGNHNASCQLSNQMDLTVMGHVFREVSTENMATKMF